MQVKKIQLESDMEQQTGSQLVKDYVKVVYCRPAYLTCMQSVCMLSPFSCVLLYVTPWTVACQSPLSMGILQARILEWVAMPSSGDLPDPGVKPMSHVSCIDRRVLYDWHPICRVHHAEC